METFEVIIFNLQAIEVRLEIYLNRLLKSCKYFPCEYVEIRLSMCKYCSYFTYGGKAVVTSSLTAYMGHASDLAVKDGAMGLRPTHTFGFGEVVKAFFGWVDDALVYIWE